MARQTGKASKARTSKSVSTRAAVATRKRMNAPVMPPAAVRQTVSPLAPPSFAKLPPLAGVRLASGEANIRYRERKDVLLAVLAPGTQVAGVFTRSKTASAPVDWCRENLAGGTAMMLVANSGNANAFTGLAGAEAVRNIA